MPILRLVMRFRRFLRFFSHFQRILPFFFHFLGLEPNESPLNLNKHEIR